MMNSYKEAETGVTTQLDSWTLISATTISSSIRQTSSLEDSLHLQVHFPHSRSC
jgi:hypothetical protein